MTQSSIPDSFIYIQRDYDMLYKLHELLEEHETIITDESGSLLEIAEQISKWQKVLRDKMTELQIKANRELKR